MGKGEVGEYFCAGMGNYWSGDTLEEFGFDFFKSESLCFRDKEEDEQKRHHSYDSKSIKQNSSSQQCLQ